MYIFKEKSHSMILKVPFIIFFNHENWKYITNQCWTYIPHIRSELVVIIPKCPKSFDYLEIFFKQQTKSFQKNWMGVLFEIDHISPILTEWSNIDRTTERTCQNISILWKWLSPTPNSQNSLDFYESSVPARTWCDRPTDFLHSIACFEVSSFNVRLLHHHRYILIKVAFIDN